MNKTVLYLKKTQKRGIPMTTVTLGRTGITANKNAFGALPIQRVEKKEAVYILQKAFYNGVNFFDSARGYTDS